MLQFSYRAIDSAGKKLIGRVEAGTVESAVRILREQGLLVINLRIQADGILGIFTKVRKPVGLGEIAAFTRQFATMIAAGITITEALSIMRDQVGRNLAPILEQLLPDVEAGSSLSSALEKHPKIFSSVYVALVRAGETGGVLDEVLLRLADNLEKQREFQGKVIGALIYPAIVLIGMLVVGSLMMLFVIPRLAQVYRDFQTELPFLTKVVIFISAFLTKFWWLAGIFLILGLWAFLAFFKTPFGKRKVDELILRIPVFGPLIRQIMLTEFTRTLGLLVGTGVLIVDSLQVVSRVSGNEVLSDAVDKVAKDVERGFPLSYALGQEEEAFPSIIPRMVAVGEETGKLQEMLGKISSLLETEAEQKVRALATTIEPIIMIVLGVGVGLLVIAVILPIYNLTAQLK